MMFKHLLLHQNGGVKNEAICLAVLCGKKENYLSGVGTDPRIMKSSTLLKLGLGNI